MGGRLGLYDSDRRGGAPSLLRMLLNGTPEGILCV
jgi:hypothetical protein